MAFGRRVMHRGLLGDQGWMAEALHVSNGDGTDLAGTGLARRIVFWRDVLHEGPVPAVGREELRRVRAAFLAGRDDRGEVLRVFLERDAAVEANGVGSMCSGSRPICMTSCRLWRFSPG